MCLEIMSALGGHSIVAMFSGVASLDLMLGYTFYNRPCLATGMLVHTCINVWLLFEKCKVRLTIAKLALSMRCRTNV